MKKKAGQKGKAKASQKRSMKDLPAKPKGGAAVKGGVDDKHKGEIEVLSLRRL